MSSVVGTVLILAITVSTFGGLAVFVMKEVDDQGSGPRIDLQVASTSGRFVVQHRGGESIRVADAILYVYDGTSRHTFPLSSFSELGAAWDVGESLVVTQDLAGSAPRGVEVIATIGGRSMQLIVSGDLDLVPPPPPPPPPPPGPDLIVTTATSPVLVSGTQAAFTAGLLNQGDTAASTHAVLFEVLDATSLAVLWSEPAAGPAIDSLATATVTSPAWTASQTEVVLRVTADSANAVTESDETNNVYQSAAFTPLPSGSSHGAYKDIDGDALFTPGLDEPIDIGPLDPATCGAFCGADIGFVVPDPGDGTRPGLVIPASVGPVSGSGGDDIAFAAPGDIDISADIETQGGGNVILHSSTGNVTLVGQSVTNGQGDITISAAGDVDLRGAYLSSTGQASVIRITAGGDVLLDGTTLRAAIIIVEAASTSSIFQQDTRFEGNGGDAVENTNDTCVTGTLAAGAWATAPDACA